MEALFVATENDIRTWIKEAVKEGLQEILSTQLTQNKVEEEFLSRKEIAKKLGISLVTLTDWVKHGLPSHKQRGRVYFDKNEVLLYIKEKKIRQINFTSKLHHLKTEVTKWNDK